MEIIDFRKARRSSLRISCFLALAVCGFFVATGWAQEVRLRAGDRIEIRIGGVPGSEMAAIGGQYAVDGTGYINLAHIGKIRAAGLTQAELQAAIESAYKSGQIYTNPTITVSVPMAARWVNVGGEVKSPKRVEYTPDLTVLGAINAAGGFTEYASQGKIRILRGDDVIMADAKAIRKDPSRDVALRPGDLIEVPRSFF